MGHIEKVFCPSSSHHKWEVQGHCQQTPIPSYSRIKNKSVALPLSNDTQKRKVSDITTELVHWVVSGLWGGVEKGGLQGQGDQDQYCIFNIQTSIVKNKKIKNKKNLQKKVCWNTTLFLHTCLAAPVVYVACIRYVGHAMLASARSPDPACISTLTRSGNRPFSKNTLVKPGTLCENRVDK